MGEPRYVPTETAGEVLQRAAEAMGTARPRVKRPDRSHVANRSLCQSPHRRCRCWSERRHWLGWLR